MFGSNETCGSIAELGFVLLDRELAFPSEKQVLCSLKVKRFYSCDWTKLPKRGIIYSVCLGYKKLSASSGLMLMTHRHIQPLTALLFLICWVTPAVCFFWLVGLQSASLCLLIGMILFLSVRPMFFVFTCCTNSRRTQGSTLGYTWVLSDSRTQVIPQTASAIFPVKSGIKMLLQHINLT